MRPSLCNDWPLSSLFLTPGKCRTTTAHRCCHSRRGFRDHRLSAPYGLSSIGCQAAGLGNRQTRMDNGDGVCHACLRFGGSACGCQLSVSHGVGLLHSWLWHLFASSRNPSRRSRHERSDAAALTALALLLFNPGVGAGAQLLFRPAAAGGDSRNLRPPCVNLAGATAPPHAPVRGALRNA